MHADAGIGSLPMPSEKKTPLAFHQKLEDSAGIKTGAAKLSCFGLGTHPLLLMYKKCVMLLRLPFDRGLHDRRIISASTRVSV